MNHKIFREALHIPQNGPSAKGGVIYALHFEATISNVPAPTAVRLFASDLIVFVGFAKKNNISIYNGI